jgi:outer membrane protein assembly factor BamE (lipoprotein component of BamABCDE complex)
MNDSPHRAPRLSAMLSVAMVMCLIFSGCAFVRGKYGDPFDSVDVEQIKRGASTRLDVSALLGAPDRIEEVNGREMFQYYRYDVKSGTVLFFSRTNVQGQDLFILFNQQGIVEDVVYGKPKRPQKFQFWPFGD